MNAQERFWKGGFGTAYTQRNRVEWQQRVPFWQQILGLTEARSVLDVGCNAGWNLHAIKEADPQVMAVGIDVNDDALAEANANFLDARPSSLYQAGEMFHGIFDLVCTSGVLIHVPPNDLQTAMKSIAMASKRWVLAVEYDNDQEEEVIYRGSGGLLWKRPFGKLYEEMGMRLVHTAEAQGFDQCRAWLMVKP